MSTTEPPASAEAATTEPTAEPATTGEPTTTAEPATTTAEPSATAEPAAKPATAEVTTTKAGEWQSFSFDRQLFVKALNEHAWLLWLTPDYRGHESPDDADAMAGYRAPDWNLWWDLPTWDVVTQAIPLMLGHDPDYVRQPPYLQWRWCYDNLGHPIVRIVRVILEHMGKGLPSIERTRWGRYEPKVIGYDTAPPKFVAWATSKPSLTVPPLLREALAEMRRRSAPTKPAALPSVDAPPTVIAVSPKWTDVPLPTINKPEIRRAFVIYVAQRCGGVEVPPNKAGSEQLIREYESTIAKYTNDEAQFPNWYEPLREFASRYPGGWGLVFEALDHIHPLDR